jgi:hypothetical protein
VSEEFQHLLIFPICFLIYTKTGLVFGFSKNQILVAVIPGLENAEDFTRLPAGRQGQNSFWFLSENYFEMSITPSLPVFYTTQNLFVNHEESYPQLFFQHLYTVPDLNKIRCRIPPKRLAPARLCRSDGDRLAT